MNARYEFRVVSTGETMYDAIAASMARGRGETVHYRALAADGGPAGPWRVYGSNEEVGEPERAQAATAAGRPD